MTTKLDKQLSKYQSNVWPSMLRHLARHLGVTADSLSRLDLGWAPIVRFKKGPNYQGWWAIPERDEVGKPVGLSLRSQSDFKCMYPGSKHGLVYEINPNHERGRPQYKHGAHNWARLHDAGVDCPVCGKPDGCLVSSEDTDDPQAVICIRQKEGAAKPMRFGYLHVRKEEGKVQGQSVLPPSESPVIVVEGMTDCAAAMDLGFVAVGRPSNLACTDLLKDVLRNRHVVIVGENDDVNPQTGKQPGREGMVAAFQVLKSVARSARMLMPPEHLKDLRQWIRADGLTQAGLLQYIEQHGQQTSEQKVLPDDKPLTLATGYLDSCHRMAGRYLLRYYRGQWYRYTGTKYEEVEEESEIRGPLYGWADDKYVLHTTPKGEETIQPVHCTRGMVGNIMDAMYYPCPVNADDIPCWINDADGPHPSDLIAFSNGLLWISKYLEGASEDQYLLPPTPDYFNVFALPYAFDPTADCPEWKRWIRSTLADDADKPRLLREWIGYCMTPDTSLHKMMLIRGAPRSGKSTALQVLEAVVGEDQCASTSFGTLTSEFGLQPLVGKLVALMGDARMPRQADSMRALEILLNIVGEDPQSVNRKYLPSLPSTKLKCRFTIATNELPELPDHSGALEARLNILDFNRSFIGQEDFGLKDRLLKEAPGIAVWALGGLRRLRENGRFTLPKTSEQSLREFRTTTSPMAAFVEECCDEDIEYQVSKQELYDAWNAWSQERGIRSISKSRFFERLKANAAYARSDTYERGGHKYSVYRGIQLKDWAERRLLGRPS